jgi:hypothetical protein
MFEGVNTNIRKDVPAGSSPETVTPSSRVSDWTTINLWNVVPSHCAMRTCNMSHQRTVARGHLPLTPLQELAILGGQLRVRHVDELET